MKYPATLIIAALFCSTAVAAPEQTTCDSPCDCHDAYGEVRWSVKTGGGATACASGKNALHPSRRLMVNMAGMHLVFICMATP